MTVSLCLRDEGQGRAAPATRERVLAAVRELGYRPNLRGRALRLGRTNIVAFYAGHGFVNVRSSFFTEIVSGMQEGCEVAKKDLLLHGTFHNSSSEDIFGELLDGRIDGLVVNMPPADALVSSLVGSQFAVVAIADEIAGVPSIIADDGEGGRLIADHFYRQGHKNVLYARSSADPQSGRRRRESFLAAAASFGMSAEVVLAHGQGDWRPAVFEMVRSGRTAIACWNDELARNMVAAFVDAGFDVPRQVAIAGFDGCPIAVREALPLTTIAAPWAEAGKSAVLALHARLSGEAVAPQVILPVRFVRGATS